MLATPELDKIYAAREHSQIIGDFIETLSKRGMALVAFNPHDDWNPYFPIYSSTEQILAEYFEIDLKKAEKERELILEDFRLRNSTIQ